MRRRDFLGTGIAMAAALLRPGATSLGRESTVTWSPYQNLDLNPKDMVSDDDIACIIEYAREFTPQTSTGKPAYDPNDPDKPGTERPLEGYGKRIKASEISIATPHTYNKAVQIKEGLVRLLAADSDHVVREMLEVGLKCHTMGFDHPTDGITVPPGFNWDWVLTVPHEVADAHRQEWIAAEYAWSATPSTQLAAQMVKDRGWPTGWLDADARTRTAVQYTIMPDLRVRACREFFLDRYAMINEELGLVNVGLHGKSGLLHGSAAVRNRPDTPDRAGPWLPSPYPGDSYRDANVALVQEAVARFGAERVTWTNTFRPSAEERAAQGLPDYVSLRDGGIRAIYDEWYGSRMTNWQLPALVAKGALRSGS